jgi:broad specificity phosphatase PhoE
VGFRILQVGGRKLQMGSEGFMVLLRHGVTEHNLGDCYQGRLDTRLSQEGRNQVRCAVPALLDLGIARVFSSPLLRALESAEIIAEPLGCGVSIFPDFSERSMGVFEGLNRDEAKRCFPLLCRREVMHSFNWAPPGGETLAEVAKRVRSGLMRLLATPPPSSVLVTHGTIAKVIHWLSGKASDGEFFRYSLANGAFEVYERHKLRASLQSQCGRYAKGLVGEDPSL